MDAAGRRNLALFAIAAVGSVGVFLLPWFIPVSPTPIVSDSYMVGFANWASVVALLVTAVALAAVSARMTAPATAGSPLWRAGPPVGRRRSLLVVVVLTGVSVVTGAGLVWITCGTAYGETGFFLDRMAQLAAGYRPFLDFGYGYTLGGLYGPVWLWRLFRADGLSPLVAYYIVYFVFALCSYWFLYLLVGRLALRDGQRAWILACVGLPAAFNATLGIQYLLVRYLTPAVALVALHVWFTSSRARHTWRKSLVGTFIALSGLVLTLVLASPEMAVALFAATIGYLIVLARAERRAALLAIAIYICCLLPFSLVGRGYLSLVASFASGAFNIPVLPGPPALLYGLAVVTVAILLPTVLRGTAASERPLTVGLVVFAAVLVPAAFGRADFGHVFVNRLVVFVLAAAFLARLHPRLFIPFLVAVVVVFSVAQYVYVTHFVRPQLLQATATSGSLTDAQFATLGRATAWPPGSGPTADPRDYIWPKATAGVGLLDACRRIAAPAGFYPSDATTAFRLAASGRYALDPVAGLGFTAGDLDRKLAALSQADCVLVPSYFVRSIEEAQPGDTPSSGWASASGTHDYGVLTMFPMTLHERNPQPNLGGLLAAYIKQDFRRAGSWSNYAVFVRGPAPK